MLAVSVLVFLTFADMAGAYYCVVVMKSIAVAFLIAFCVVTFSQADQVTMQNGDLLNGKVLSITTTALVLQNDNLGTITLPRAKVATVTLGTMATRAPLSASPNNIVVINKPKTAPENSPSDMQNMFRGIRDHTNLVQEVEAQVLGSSASPAAIDKFNELLDGLSTGKIDMNGLRAEAQSAVDQLQEYKKEMGSSAGEEVDGYLSILNHFLNETAEDSASTNSAAP
jgi:hypothetical protein